ncbi:hypothetical protein DL764_007383 [Monosporascus ibericus]|uniref:Uncharacterized protein n=1 Tax=Monosporascus ibericus TaxID=155417 RepID=A0A4Q4T410_9PEZI|nr:hypothetical protein DL764_007383 [Monosporascus ibericus]
MGNPENYHVGVSQPTEATDPSVLDAMMSDLGIGRLEDLATDDGGKHGRRQGLPPQSSHNKQIEASQTRPGTSNVLAEMYRSAIKEGVFHDDDYHTVKNLDAIEDGNLHRQKQASLHSGHSNSVRSFSAQDRRPFQGAASRARRFPQYDPLQPSYRSLNSGRSRRTMESVAPGYDVSSLGGLHVPGMPVKRWGPGQKVLSTADANPNGGTLAPSREQPVTMQPAPPRAVLDKPTEDLPPHLRPTRPTTHLNGKAPSNIVSPQATNGVAETKQPTPKTPKVTEVYETTKSNGWLPPHLRRPSNTAQSHGKAVRLSTNTTQLPSSTRQTEQSEVSVTLVETCEYLFQAEVVLQYQVNGQLQKGLGQVCVYELAQRPVVIWELIVGERVTRKDIGRLLLPFVNGSLVIVRWQDKPGSDIQTSDIRFDNISAARDFEKVVKQQREQRAHSTAPIFEQETEVLSDVPPSVTPEYLPNRGRTQTVDTSFGVSASTGLAQAQEDKRATITPREERATKQTRTPELILNTASHEEEPKDPRGQGSSVALLPLFADENTSEYLIDLSDCAKVKTIRRSYMDDLMGVDLAMSSVPNVGAGSPTGGEVEAMNVASVVEAPADEIDASALMITENSSGSKAMTQDQSGRARPPASTSLETAFLNLKTTETKSLEEHIPQDALRFLYYLPPKVYEEMMKMSHDIVPHFELAQCVPPGQAKITEYAPFQIAWVRLGRIEEYNSLGWDAKQTVLRVVYYNMVHGSNRIVRSPDDMLRLRDSKQSCPDEVKELNELVRMGNHREISKCDPYSRTNPAPLAQPSPYRYEVITKKALGQAKFLYGDQPQEDVKPPASAADSARTEQTPSAGVLTAQIRPPNVATATKTDNQKSDSASVDTHALLSDPKNALDRGVTTQQSRSVSGWDFIDEAEEDWDQKPQPPVVYKF